MQYDLVFEGGGAKGFVFIGAMQEFEAQGHTFGRLLGTSAGAITATLVAAGYNSQEMLAALGEKVGDRSVFETFMGEPEPFDEAAVRDSITRDFLRNLDLPLVPDFVEEKLDDQIVGLLSHQPRFRHLFSFIERGGWFSASNFTDWMRRKLDSGTFKGQPRNFSQLTFKEFYSVSGVDLSLIGSDTTTGQILVLNHRTAPDCPVVWAVRMSMSIPLLWQEVVWQDDWGTYQGREMAGHVIVDGGMLSNFPIELFISNMDNVAAVMGEKISHHVLGLLIDDDAPVPGVSSQTAESESHLSLGTLHTVQRLQNLLNTMLQAHDKMVIDSVERKVVRLPAKGYGTTEFNMTKARQTALINAGREAMLAYFEQMPGEAVSFSSAPDPAVQAANRIAARLLSLGYR